MSIRRRFGSPEPEPQSQTPIAETEHTTRTGVIAIAKVVDNLSRRRVDLVDLMAKTGESPSSFFTKLVSGARTDSENLTILKLALNSLPDGSVFTVSLNKSGRPPTSDKRDHPSAWRKETGLDEFYTARVETSDPRNKRLIGVWPIDVGANNPFDYPTLVLVLPINRAKDSMADVQVPLPFTNDGDPNFAINVTIPQTS